MKTVYTDQLPVNTISFVKIQAFDMHMKRACIFCYFILAQYDHYHSIYFSDSGTAAFLVGFSVLCGLGFFQFVSLKRLFNVYSALQAF